MAKINLGLYLLNLIFILYCATSTCRALDYQPGLSYNYQYTTSVSFKTKSSLEPVGTNIHLDLHILPLLVENDVTLLKLQIREGRSRRVSESDQSQAINSIATNPLFFTLNGGHVENVYVSTKESTTNANLKKGVVGLLQVQQADTTISEVDVLGECETQYSVSGSDVTKEKRSCKKSEIGDEFLQTDQVRGVTVAPTSVTNYKIANGVIESAISSHNVLVHINVRGSVGADITSRQELTLKGTSKSDEKIEGDIQATIKKLSNDYVLSLLPAVADPVQCTADSCKPVSQTNEQMTETLESLTSDKISTIESAKTFLKLVRLLRYGTKADIDKLLYADDELLPQIIDAAVASQSPIATKAILSHLDFTDTYSIDLVERYLFALAHITHPEADIISDILNLISNGDSGDKVQESLLLTAGALVHTYCQDKQLCQSQVVQRYTTMVQNGLSTCTEDACTLTYLRSLSNAGLPSTTIDIMQYVNSDSRMVAVAAIDSVRRLTPGTIDSEVIYNLCGVVKQTTYDSSVRIAALHTVLLANPDKTCLDDIRDIATDNDYIKDAIRDAAKYDDLIREKFSFDESTDEEESETCKSAVFSGHIAETQDVNGTYTLRLENTASGLMKRSSMIVAVARGQHTSPLLQFGLYAEGLEAMVSDDTSEESEEATAGMSLQLKGVLVRPMEFFRGSGEMLSAAWNAPSDLTPALQGNIMGYDHSEKVILPNGLIANLRVESALSIDLSGSISISLWSRNSQSLVRNSGAMFVEGELSLEAAPYTSGVKFAAEAATYVDFTTKVDFYDMPITMCLQMHRPEFTFTENYESHEIINQERVTKTDQREVTVDGQNLPLHKQNDSQCKKLEDM